MTDYELISKIVDLENQVTKLQSQITGQQIMFTVCAIICAISCIGVYVAYFIIDIKSNK